MANIEVKLRKGTTSQHAGFTGAEGEVTVDTDLDTLRVHDGSTAGGERLAKYSELSGAGAGGTVTSVDSGTGLTGGPITSSGTLSIADDGITPAMISSTDTLLNVNDTHQTIGLGILANASSSFPKVKMDGGVQVGDQAPTLTSINSELSVTGNGNLNLLTVENTSTTSTDQSVVVVKGPVPTLQLNDTVAPTDEGVINVNMTDGVLKFTLISDDTLTTTDLVTINSNGTLSGTNVVESRGSLNQVLRSHSNNGLGYVVLYSGSEGTDEKRVNLVPANGKFAISWVNDSGGAGLAVQLDQATGDWEPGSNGTQDLGSTGLRWDNVWSAGTFNGSDQNIKQDIEDLDEAEKRVAVKAKGLIKKYRMKDAVAKKGDDARIHVGIIAQELQAAFESEGLDAFRYSMIGKDTWWEGTDSEGNRDVKYEATDGYAEVTQMSVRYNELLAFIIAAM